MKVPGEQYVFTVIIVICLFVLCIFLPACQPTEPTVSTTMPVPPTLTTETPTITDEAPEIEITQVTLASSEVSVNELKDKLDNGHRLLLIDVRSKVDYDRKHIDGAVSMPLKELPDRYHEIPEDVEIIVYSGCT